MTISTEIAFIRQVGNGATTAFSFPYHFFENGDLVVYLETTADGTAVLQVLDTDYTLAGADNPSGGTITFLSAPASTKTVMAFRKPDLEQTVNFTSFIAGTANDALDRIYEVLQYDRFRLDRAIRLPDTAAGATLTLPHTSLRANKALGFDASGNVEAIDRAVDLLEQNQADLSLIQGYAQAAAGSAAAASGSADDAAADAASAAADAASAEASKLAAANSAVLADAAQQSASNAESNVVTQASNAAASALAAAGSASAADADATAAAASALTASQQATAAGVSADEAAASAASIIGDVADAEAARAGAEAAQVAAEAAQTAAEAAQAGAEAAQSAAQTAETNAETAETNAETAQAAAESARDAAQTAETNAETAETNAETAATTATTQAGIATTQAGIATTQAGLAATSASNAAAALDAFDDIYLGSKASDPTLDNDGNALVEGQLYWNSSANNLRIYDGAMWNAYSAAVGITALVEDTSPQLGGNLDLNGFVITGLEIGTNVQAYSANLDGWSAEDPGDYYTSAETDSAISGAVSALSSVYQPLDAQLTSLSDASANGVSLVTAADYAAMKALLDLEIGTDVQAYSANLDGWSGEDPDDYSTTAEIAAAYQPLDAELTALAGISSNGVLARTGAGTAAARTMTGTTNQISIADGDGASGNPTFSLATQARTVAITCVIDGGGSTITTGVKGDLEIPFACTLTASRMFADQTGSIVIDIWKDTYANFPPTNADTITGGNEPAISSGTKDEDTSLTSWTTSISAGDILRFNVDSVSSIQRLTINLTAVKT